MNAPRPALSALAIRLIASPSSQNGLRLVSGRQALFVSEIGCWNCKRIYTTADNEGPTLALYSRL